MTTLLGFSLAVPPPGNLQQHTTVDSQGEAVLFYERGAPVVRPGGQRLRSVGPRVRFSIIGD